MRVMYFVKTLCLCKTHHMTFLGTLSYAFFRSMKAFLLFPVSLHKLPYQEDRLYGRSLRHKTKLVFGDVGHSP
jgi:hypothetical protein